MRESIQNHFRVIETNETNHNKGQSGNTTHTVHTITVYDNAQVSQEWRKSVERQLTVENWEIEKVDPASFWWCYSDDESGLIWFDSVRFTSSPVRVKIVSTIAVVCPPWHSRRPSRQSRLRSPSVRRWWWSRLLAFQFQSQIPFQFLLHWISISRRCWCSPKHQMMEKKWFWKQAHQWRVSTKPFLEIWLQRLGKSHHPSRFSRSGISLNVNPFTAGGADLILGVCNLDGSVTRYYYSASSNLNKINFNKSGWCSFEIFESFVLIWIDDNRVSWTVNFHPSSLAATSVTILIQGWPQFVKSQLSAVGAVGACSTRMAWLDRALVRWHLWPFSSGNVEVSNLRLILFLQFTVIVHSNPTWIAGWIVVLFLYGSGFEIVVPAT